MLKKLSLITLSLTVVACASGKFTGDASLLYAESPDAAHVVVMRQSAFTASGVRFPLELDGKVIATLGSGDYIKLPVSPGKHFLVMKLSKYKFIEKIDATSGNDYFLRFRISIFGEGGPWIFERLTSEGGRSEIASKKYDEIEYRR